MRARPGAVRVVFLDHVLPDIQGVDLAWRIGSMESPPRVVLVTGLADVSATQELPAGTHVLAKPFLRDDLSRLLATVKESLVWFRRAIWTLMASLRSPTKGLFLRSSANSPSSASILSRTSFSRLLSFPACS